MQRFADLGLTSFALDAVTRLGYDEPTPVQEQAIPVVLEGRDLIAAASTGTGKTAAFLLPVMGRLPKDRSRNRLPRLVVVSPTRELAQQIAFTAMKIARCTGHFVTTVYGGTAYGPQIKEIRRGTDVLIATPGRLNDLMKRDVVDLSGTQVLVLDEADRMLDMGFLPDVTTIVEATPTERQTLLFSATIDSSIQNNLATLLRDPAIVEIAHKGETAATVEQFIMPVQQNKKPELLRAVLDEKGSKRVIVFARTRGRAEDFAKALAEEGYKAESIHSEKSVGQRRRALENFRKGKTDILVATDVLARGIDVPSVDHVINLDLPDCPEDYVHRIGRTGRAGETGYAISFASPSQRKLLVEIEKLIDREIPFMPLETFELDPNLLTRKGKGRAGASRGGKGGAGHKAEAGKREGRGGKGRGKNDGGKRPGDGKRARDERAGDGKKWEDRRGGKAKGGRGERGAEGREERGAAKPANRADRRRERFGDGGDYRRGGKGAGRGERNDRGGRGEGRGRANRDENYGRDPRNAKRGGYASSKPSGMKGAAAAASKRNKKRPSNVVDIRSFGEHRGRVKNRHFDD